MLRTTSEKFADVNVDWMGNILWYAKQALKNINKIFKPSTAIVGNKKLYYRYDMVIKAFTMVVRIFNCSLEVYTCTVGYFVTRKP